MSKTESIRFSTNNVKDIFTYDQARVRSLLGSHPHADGEGGGSDHGLPSVTVQSPSLVKLGERTVALTNNGMLDLIAS